MKNFMLNKEQVNELRVAHRAERNRHAAYKINAVIFLGTGWKLKNVKQALLLDDETLRSYVEKYKTGGIYPWRLRYRFLVCVIFVLWRGEVTSNSRPIARNFPRCPLRVNVATK